MNLSSSDDVIGKYCKLSSLTIRPDRCLPISKNIFETQSHVCTFIKASIFISPAFRVVTPSLEKAVVMVIPVDNFRSVIGFVLSLIKVGFGMRARLGKEKGLHSVRSDEWQRHSSGPENTR